MRTLRFLLQKEFKQIFRNRAILPLIFAMPIIQLLILPLAADYEIKNINISVVDHDHSTLSKQLVEKIIASGYFRLNDFSASFDESFEQFQKDHSDLILEIPRGFEKNLVQHSNEKIFIAVNAINGTKASIGSAYLTQILSKFNPEMNSALPGFPQIEIKTQNWYNPHLNYPVFMVPGILVILVTMIGAYMCALNIVKEKEVGTIEQINVTPIPKHLFILGKLIPFLFIGIFVFTLGLFGVARLVYQIVPLGSVLTLYSFLLLYLIALLGVGLIISNYSQTQQQAMSLAFFFMMIFILMSGLFTPIDSMPFWAQGIAHLNPVTYFIEVTRSLILKGSGLAELKNQFMTITAMAIVFNSWAILSYKKRS